MDTRTDDHPAILNARTGGARRQFRLANTYERNERSSRDHNGSHMPIDTAIHWEWRNPLNILPALILVFLVIAVIAMVLA
jgi:hypothetical protein